jgi:hypothetical protein
MSDFCAVTGVDSSSAATQARPRLLSEHCKGAKEAKGAAAG